VSREPKPKFFKSAKSFTSRRPKPAAPPIVAKKTPSRRAEPPRAAPVLSAQRARELRAEAHALDPIVHVGHAGINESVVRAVGAALRDHELIKVRLHDPEDKRAMAAQIAEATRAALCGLVGHTLILYRPRPKQKHGSGVARSSIRRNQPKPRK
jgi:RNA-binding protein